MNFGKSPSMVERPSDGPSGFGDGAQAAVHSQFHKIGGSFKGDIGVI